MLIKYVKRCFNVCELLIFSKKEYFVLWVYVQMPRVVKKNIVDSDIQLSFKGRRRIKQFS